MQLDFLTKLTGWFEACEPSGQTQRPPELKPDDATLTALARGLLLGLECDRLAGRVRVRWNSRMRTTAGLASYAHSLVTLNPRLAQFGEPEIDKTLRHELAHLLAHHRAGRRRIAPHGAEWRQACRDLGLPDEKRCHELPLPRRKLSAKHTYHCPACRTYIKRVRPFGRRVACLACCKTHNNGRYHEKFRLVKVDGQA
jgi:predicted SprT family Zn-dependent metalloprotease